MSATEHVRGTASRAADSKPLELVARGGFVMYGVIHLLFAWLALQVAFGNSAESDQSGAIQHLAAQPFGKFLVVVSVIGMIGLAVWQAFEAAIGESGVRGRTALVERVVSGFRAVLYLYFAWIGVKVLQGVNASTGDSQEKNASTMMDGSGGRLLIGIVGIAVAAIGIGLVVYGVTGKFEKHLNTHQMNATVRRTTRRLGVAGYSAKGVAYTIAGALIVAAAVTYDPEKARGLDAALKLLAGQPYGPWLLGLVALGIAAYGVYCFSQSRYRKV
ncbi:DUF1206 domain-containing protein [Amorphoplanes digitatis]|uniref:DUF1206 domain-containing protein n=1 Tax=Actinoplanes digitatis TaxID=1868 RepID=A0A7W7MNL3_9ACTN|nr:DUF1206 domain-containing protein [Actinoplanes digitatis]MBB4761168.1 hypothetical protein [Actinoplanes digitatis]GID92784.1 hypothetical protein Adi01nite_21960 [Actinoplanes digitatis]